MLPRALPELPLSAVDFTQRLFALTQLPDLPRALREIARISAPGAMLTASTFAEGPADDWRRVKRWLHARIALHFVPVTWLEEQLAAVGFDNYRWSFPGGWFAYTAAQKTP